MAKPISPAQIARANEQLNAAIEHHRAGRTSQALPIVKRVLQKAPSHPDANHIAAVLLVSLQQPDQAQFYAERAASLDPKRAAFWTTLGNVRLALLNADKAVKAFERAIAIDPAAAEAHSGLGVAHRDLLDDTRAEQAFRRAIELAPANPSHTINLSLLLLDSGGAREACDLLLEAERRDPGDPLVSDHLCYALNYDDSRSPEDVFAAHRRFGQLVERNIKAAANHPNTPDPDRKLRVGYVSRELRRHSVAFFLEPIVEHIDRSRFEVVCYATGRFRDKITERFQLHADLWRDCQSLDDSALIAQIRSDQIDVLVELSGHTSGHHLIALAAKPAPVQVTCIGYPHTTGLTRIDARLIDEQTDPSPGADAFAAERLVRIPDCFLTYRPPESAPAPAIESESDRLTFASFNDIKKIGPSTVARWAEILDRVPGSRLLIKSRGLESPVAQERTRKRFAEAGVNDEAIEIVGRVESLEGHLALYNAVDIALDTFPYNGTTTTCEAMWMGVPVVTFEGDRHAARVGASLLRAVGLDELVAPDVEGYVALAAELAADPARLSALRSSLRTRLAESPLCEAEAHTRHVEQAYRSLWKDWCARQPGA